MKTVFFGTPEWAVPSLEALAASSHRPGLVITQPAKRRARGGRASPSPIGQAGERLGLTCIEPSSVRDAAVLERLAGEGAAVFVVVAYGEILPRAVLEAAPHGCVNLHFSLLPRYRGAAPVQWAIANGESETGVTTMRIVPKLDAGPIYLQEATGIGPEERAPHLGSRLAAAGARLLLKTLGGIEDGTLEAREQDGSAATYARALTAADGSADWSARAEVVARRIRGFDPWPGQAALARKGRIKLLEAKAASHVDASSTPGLVLGAASGTCLIRCGEGTVLEVLSLRAEGKRAISGEEALRGRLLALGEVLGGIPPASA